MAGNEYHTPVLLREAVDYLLSAQNGIFIDGTLGGGGHAEAILTRLSPESSLICFDMDEDAIRTASHRLENFGNRVTIIRDNFHNLRKVLWEKKIDKIAGLLLDLGVSSFQLDEPAKGFSFQSEERLDMRMDQRQELDAFAVVNHYGEQELADVLWKFGEERHSRRIARAIIRTRTGGPIVTTRELASVVKNVAGGKFQTKTLARVFQAVRIEVNQELESLRRTLEESIRMLQQGGRIVVISYHSLEDRIVKEIFREAARNEDKPSHVLLPSTPRVPIVSLITRKPVIPSEEEQQRNPRARSAKMRVIEKC